MSPDTTSLPAAPAVSARANGVATPLRVLIVGAGMSGLLAGIKLKQAGIETFEILEMAADVGGTWRDNTYPGLACDVPAHGYAYSFEPNWRWSGTFASGPEIQQYFSGCADKYGVRPHVRFNTAVTRIERTGDEWVVTASDGVRRADVVITCLGGLVHPKYPDIKGLDSFAGARFHSARWDHSVPLDGRRVGVIGTGSTAIQITCALAPRAAHYSLFQRTPQWVCRNFEMKRPRWIQALQRWFPWLARISGRFQNWLTEVSFARAVVGDSPRMLSLVEHLVQGNLEKVRDPELRRKLTPDYRVGCKRLIFSDGFYDAIQHPNAELVTAGISHIEPRGVVTTDGRLHELDVLVTATGFHALDYTRNMTVVGTGGRTLTEAWAQGPQGHRAVAIAGFPNLFTVIGPHSPVGNYSLTSISENQLDYIMHFVRMLARGECRQVAPSAAAQARYNDGMREGLRKTVWTTGCVSWYLDASGLPNLYPFTPKQYRSELAAPDLAEYEVA